MNIPEVLHAIVQADSQAKNEYETLMAEKRNLEINEESIYIKARETAMERAEEAAKKLKMQKELELQEQMSVLSSGLDKKTQEMMFRYNNEHEQWEERIFRKAVGLDE